MVSPSRSDAVFDLVVGERGKGWVSCRTETFEDLADAFFSGLEALTFTIWLRYCDLCLTMTVRYVWIWMTKSYQKWDLFPSTISASRKKKGFGKLRWHNLDGYWMSHENFYPKKCLIPSFLDTLRNGLILRAPVARSCYQFWNIWSRKIELNIDSSNQSRFSTITQYGIRQLDTRCCPLDQFGHGEFTGDVFASSNLFRDSLVESEILHP